MDTNKITSNELAEIPPANRFLMSSFDRRAYASRKRGERELAEDTHATTWLHTDISFEMLKVPVPDKSASRAV